MVTNPLLSLFKEQLEAECATLRKDYGFLTAAICSLLVFPTLA